MVEDEIKKARDLFACYGESIAKDKNCACLLKDYRSAIDTTRSVMESLNIIEMCAECSQKKIGGCCFIGVEEWYDHTLFLINLLMGVDIPVTRTVLNGCMFVQATGCTLIARHSFCINYLCDALKNSMSFSDQKNLMAIAGREIHSGILMEQSIRKWLDK